MNSSSVWFCSTEADIDRCKSRPILFLSHTVFKYFTYLLMQLRIFQILVLFWSLHYKHVLPEISDFSTLSLLSYQLHKETPTHTYTQLMVTLIYLNPHYFALVFLLSINQIIQDASRDMALTPFPLKVLSLSSETLHLVPQFLSCSEQDPGA